MNSFNSSGCAYLLKVKRLRDIKDCPSSAVFIFENLDKAKNFAKEMDGWRWVIYVGKNEVVASGKNEKDD